LEGPHRVAFAVMAVTLFFVGSSGGGANASERLNIAFINVSKPPAFWSRVAEMMKDAANGLEIDLTIYESDGDQAKMVSLAQKWEHFHENRTR
jgi:ABC-type sugar transport system substrate-binding protein